MRPRASSSSSIMATYTRSPARGLRAFSSAQPATACNAPGYVSDKRFSAGGAATTPTTRRLLTATPRAMSASKQVHSDPPAQEHALSCLQAQQKRRLARTCCDHRISDEHESAGRESFRQLVQVHSRLQCLLIA